MYRFYLTAVLLAATLPALAQTSAFSTRPAAGAEARQVSLPARGSAITSLVQNAAPGLIVSGNSLACTDTNTNLHNDNSYYRRFDLNGEFALSTAFTVSSVDVGVESAVAGSGGEQPIEIRLYRIANGAQFVLANLTPVGSLATTVADASLAVVNFPVASTPVDALTSDLVVEVFTPNGQAAGHAFFIGSNAAGQTAPSWLRAPDCGATEPVTTADIGSPGMHLVLIANGTVAPGQPGPGPAPPEDGPLGVPALTDAGTWWLIVVLMLAATVGLRRYR